MRRAANGRKPVVLVYTEKANTDEIGSAIIEGAAEFLLKPFDRDLLEFKLKQVGCSDIVLKAIGEHNPFTISVQ